MLSVSWMRRMLSGFGFQLATNTAMSSSRSTMSGWLRKASIAVAWIVLAAHGEDDAASLELAQVVLQAVMRLAVAERIHVDPLDAVVADDAAPQRVVEVDDDALHDPALRRQHQIDDVLRDQRQVLERAEGLGQRPQALVEPMPMADPSGQPGDVVDQDVVSLPGLLRDRDVEPRHLREQSMRRAGDRSCRTVARTAGRSCPAGSPPTIARGSCPRASPGPPPRDRRSAPGRRPPGSSRDGAH